MTLAEKILKEVEGLPEDAQEKVLRIVHVIREEFLSPAGKARRKGKADILVDIDALAVDTGIPDMAEQHDHYLYGVSKR
jgi:hypothetical protein